MSQKRKNNDEKLQFEWEDVGKLDVSIQNNHSAQLRFVPSPKVVKETLEKLSQTPKKTVKEEHQ